MLSIGVVLMLLIHSSLASDGKTDAAVSPQPVRVHVYSALKNDAKRSNGFIMKTLWIQPVFNFLRCVRVNVRSRAEQNTRMLSRCESNEKQQRGYVRRGSLLTVRAAQAV